jgi:Excisionase from transposon Tn916.
MDDKTIPLWERYVLTIEEAGVYFHIGEKRLRALVLEQPNADFYLRNGNRVLIKRKLFEKFIDMAEAV